MRKRERKELHSSGEKRKKERVRLPSRKLPHVWVGGGVCPLRWRKQRESRREREEKKEHTERGLRDGDQTIAL